MGTPLTARIGPSSAPRADPARRGGHLPGLRWRGLDLFLARARTLGFHVTALHVHHGVRGAEADADARLCLEVHRGRDRPRAGPAPTEAACGSPLRPSAGRGSARPVTPPRTRSRPSLPAGLEREHERDQDAPRRRRCEAAALPARRRGHYAEHGLPVRRTRRTPIRRAASSAGDPAVLRRLHPGADANLLALGDERPKLPRALEALARRPPESRSGTKSADLGDGVRAVREYGGSGWRERRWGPWTLSSELDGLEVRAGYRGTGSRGGARKCRISSWTRRCRKRARRVASRRTRRRGASRI